MSNDTFARSHRKTGFRGSERMLANYSMLSGGAYDLKVVFLLGIRF